MNGLKLLSLSVDEININFKGGLNYIVGSNNSGKTTFFNSIKYVLGLSKTISCGKIKKIKLNLLIGEKKFRFERLAGESQIFVFSNDREKVYRALSSELDDFFRYAFEPVYIFESESESVFSLLDFFFLSENKSSNKLKQWDVIRSISCVDVYFLESFKKDIFSLKKEVIDNKEIEDAVDEFSRLLLNSSKLENLDNLINETKRKFFKDSKEKKYLLSDAMSRFESIDNKATNKINRSVEEIERVFFEYNNYAGFDDKDIGGLESFVKGKSNYLSYGQETLSRFLLVLSIAKVAIKSKYNFPQLIVNDSYLLFDIDNNSYRKTLSILHELTNSNESLQYIEFTHRKDIPRDFVVLNLNEEGVGNVFDSE